MLIPGRHYNSEKYRFAFQGQEKDDEIKGSTGTSYAYKFRMHDPRTGRFWSIDPLTKKYPFYSPYVFSGNRVIDKIELEGLETAPYHGAHKGRAIYDSNGDGIFSEAEKQANWNTIATALIIAMDINITGGAISSFFLLHDMGEASHATDQAMEAKARGDMKTYQAKMKECQNYSANIVFEALGGVAGGLMRMTGKVISRQADIIVKTLADNSQLNDIWNSTLRKLANSGRNNAYKRYLNNLENGVEMTNDELAETFTYVRQEF